MKRKVNKSEFIRNACLEAAARVERREYPFPLTKPLKSPIGWGMCRTYHRRFWKFAWIHSTAGRVEKEDLRFKAIRIAGKLWWVDRKSWDAYFNNMTGTYDKITMTQ